MAVNRQIQLDAPPGNGGTLDGVRREVDGLREVGADFHRRGWSLGTSSNYSVVLGRDPLELLITASGKDKGRLAADDFVRVDECGRPMLQDQPKASAETLLHVVVAGCGGAGAVLHTHSVWATVLSDHHAGNGGLEIEGYEMLKGLDGVNTHEHTTRMPILENSQDMPTLAGRVRALFKSMDDSLEHGFLLRRHGLYTWGRDLAEARRHVEVFEFLFECIGQRLIMGGKLAPISGVS
jgi:methylthioribulose-1-phosphate dehydratase